MTFAFTVENVASSRAQLLEDEQPESPAITARRAKILAIVARESILAPPASPLVKSVSAVRQLRNPPQETFQLLSQTFSSDDLISTGVAYRFGEQLRLSRVFGTPQSSFRFRYCDKKNRIDAVSARGVVSGVRRELARLSSDTCDSRDRPERPCLIALSELDARLLQQLGFDVVSALPLLSWTSDDIQHYLALRHLNPYAKKWTIVVLLWRPCALSNAVHPLALQIVQRFVMRCRLLKLNGGALVRAWCPAAMELKRFREASELGEGKILASEFKKSLASSCYTPRDALTVLRDREVVNFGPALQQLEQVISQSSKFPLVSQAAPALKTLEHAFNRQIVSLLLAGAQTRSPWDGIAGLMVAQIAKDWFEGLNQVSAAREIAAGGNPEGGFDDELNLKLRSKAVEDFCKLYRVNSRRR